MIRKLRKYWRLTAILAGFAFCVPLHYLWKLFGARSPWPRIFLGHVGRRFGLRVRKEGTPLTSNVLYTPNHVSWLDILAVGGAVPAVFVTKAELDGIVRWASALNDSVYIDRNMRSAVKGQASDLRGRLAEGRAVCLFGRHDQRAPDAALPAEPVRLALPTPARCDGAARPARLRPDGRRRLDRRRGL